MYCCRWRPSGRCCRCWPGRCRWSRRRRRWLGCPGRDEPLRCRGSLDDQHTPSRPPQHLQGGTPCRPIPAEGRRTVTIVQTATAPQWLHPAKAANQRRRRRDHLHRPQQRQHLPLGRHRPAVHLQLEHQSLAIGYYHRIGVQLDDGQTYYVNIGLSRRSSCRPKCRTIRELLEPPQAAAPRRHSRLERPSGHLLHRRAYEPATPHSYPDHRSERAMARGPVPVRTWERSSS